MKLRKRQILYIDNQKYTVINMIEFEEDSWVWQEYEIVNDKNQHKWLSVEENENKQLEYYLYEKYIGIVDTNEIAILVGNETCELYEKGIAKVKNYFGNTDVDKYETCEYYEYISKDKNMAISVEKWEDETERTIGYYLPKEKIQITKEIEKDKKSQNSYAYNNKKKNIFFIIFIVLIFMPMIASAFSGLFVNKSMQKYLEKETTKYTYVTSVTNNTNNKKAKVYEASFSDMDSTVKDIIDGVPEGITEVTQTNQDTEADGIGLQTKSEYAFIYQENGKIYIQVSSKEYVKSSGTMYHARHYSRYYSCLNSRRSDKYSNYASSARQKSVNSRTASGGGTSFGK